MEKNEIYKPSSQKLIKIVTSTFQKYAKLHKHEVFYDSRVRTPAQQNHFEVVGIFFPTEKIWTFGFLNTFY